MASSAKASGVSGIHHITAIARNPQRNLDFYSGTLGLRLVKRTVNFDDPTTYHFYYGDSIGRPGTILTFFPWPDAPKGYHGTGQVTAISFLISPSSMDYWIDRLERSGVSLDGPSERFGDNVVSFLDPDGIAVELVSPSKTGQVVEEAGVWREGPVVPEHAIRGFHSATLSEEGYERTASLLTRTMGFRLAAEDNKKGRFRFISSMNPSLGSTIDILCQPATSRGYGGTGTVHHIAWRAADDRDQLDLRKRIIEEANLNPTPVMDRKYFHSVYFREPGGTLFEIATDPPGFTVDEKLEDLGKQLRLPEWLEPVRGKLEQLLPPLKMPDSEAVNRQKGRVA
ncbi:MAG TPA: ring-cleaving dioxygenase [Nitrososphaera sp.]|nr:ring-cleaving dioxygenase [Nitrososphaera sp.]